MKRRAAGFTLVEVLVVLVIVGLVSTILMQALSQVYRLQSRFGVQLAQSQRGAMVTDWFRQIVQGLQTDFVEGKDVFKGSATGFSGLSTTALSADYGAPTRFSLSLNSELSDDRMSVVYASGDDQLTLWSWSGTRRGQLIYVDAKGERHDQWPPPLGSWPQLPALILLEWQDDGAHSLAAVPRGMPEARLATRPLGLLQ